MANDFETVIVSACRTPIAAFGGALKDLSASDLGAVVIREALSRGRVSPADVGDVVMGCVLQAGAGMNVARQAALKAGLPVDVPAETINRVCGSGLQAVVHAVEAIRVGYTDTIVAGGTESMSNAPYLLKGARWGYRMGNAEAVDSMLLEGLICAMNNCHMGMTAEEVAARDKISPADQDAFAAASQQRAEFELNEAFAAQALAVSRELGLDPAKVNIHGGAIALGHPIGASGARVLTTLVHALRANKLRYGVASLCIGGGMGIAMAVEAL